MTKSSFAYTVDLKSALSSVTQIQLTVGSVGAEYRMTVNTLCSEQT